VPSLFVITKEYLSPGFACEGFKGFEVLKIPLPLFFRGYV